MLDDVAAVPVPVALELDLVVPEAVLEPVVLVLEPMVLVLEPEVTGGVLPGTVVVVDVNVVLVAPIVVEAPDEHACPPLTA